MQAHFKKNGNFIEVQTQDVAQPLQRRSVMSGEVLCRICRARCCWRAVEPACETGETKCVEPFRAHSSENCVSENGAG